MVKRVLNFDKQDWDHVSTLFFNGIKQFLKGDVEQSREAFYFMKLHFEFDSHKRESE